jgi:nicotinate-nucleotide adenylyltransferase
VSCARSSTSWRATDTSAPDRPPAPRELRSLGILGGTFNPPHLGHLAIAGQACSQLALEDVALVPVGQPPHKAIEQDPGCAHRLAMCRLLVAGREGLSVCALETEREGPSYTVDTLNFIHASHPHAELTLIVGADVASTLPAWHEPERLLELAALAVAARPGTGRRAVLEPLAALGGGARIGVEFLDSPVIDVSSSLVRERAAAGEPIDGLVGGAVAGYIAEHGLYGARVRAASR